MQIAKLLLIRIATCTMIFFSCSSKKVNKVDLPPLSLSTEIGNWKSVPPYQFLSVITTLKNNTSDTIRYASMSCSWQDAYTVNTSELSIPTECDKNISMLAVIPPYSQEQKALALVTKKSRKELQGIKIRVGFNWLMAKDQFEAYAKSKQLHEMRNLIWSKPLELQ